MTKHALEQVKQFFVPRKDWDPVFSRAKIEDKSGIGVPRSEVTESNQIIEAPVIKLNCRMRLGARSLDNF
jgi:hypothetical protein